MEEQPQGENISLIQEGKKSCRPQKTGKEMRKGAYYLLYYRPKYQTVVEVISL